MDTQHQNLTPSTSSTRNWAAKTLHIGIDLLAMSGLLIGLLWFAALYFAPAARFLELLLVPAGR